jgi:hypothetical protein
MVPISNLHLPWLAALAIATLCACRTPLAARDGQRIVLAVPRDGVPGYSIAMPAGLVRRPPDGPLVAFAGEGIQIRLDYGPTYDQPTCAPPRCRTRRLTIGGRPARSFGVDISSPGSVYTRRIWIMVDVTDQTRLGLDIVCGGGDACDRAGRIVRTIAFQQ